MQETEDKSKEQKNLNRKKQLLHQCRSRTLQCCPWSNKATGPVSSSLNIFKQKLDKYLHSVPDNPPLPGYYNINNNSLLEWKNAGRDARQPTLTYMEETVETNSTQVGPDQELAAV